jgi:hypothetical protein
MDGQALNGLAMDSRANTRMDINGESAKEQKPWVGKERLRDGQREQPQSLLEVNIMGADKGGMWPVRCRCAVAKLPPEIIRIAELQLHRHNV